VSLLEVRGVTMKFGELAANRDVSFDVEAGTIAGLIGPNGAGKTTLFNCVAGYYRPSAGSIRFDGREIAGLPPHAVARLGLARTFQIVRPLKEMSCLENVMVGAFLRTASPKEAREAAERCLASCFLADFAGRTAGGLTIGNKKRLEIARALATGPKLLLLDEAMAGLTSTEVREMVEVVRSLRSGGLTVLMVEHIMEAIIPIADRIVVLHHGEKIAAGVPAAVVRDPAVVAAYLGGKYAKKLGEAGAGGRP